MDSHGVSHKTGDRGVFKQIIIQVLSEDKCFHSKGKLGAKPRRIFPTVYIKVVSFEIIIYIAAQVQQEKFYHKKFKL